MSGSPTGAPVAGSHNRTVPSSPPMASSTRPSGSAPNATAVTAPVWPVSGSPTGAPVTGSHNRTVPSSLPVASSTRPSGSTPNATARHRVGVAGERQVRDHPGQMTPPQPWVVHDGIVEAQPGRRQCSCERRCSALGMELGVGDHGGQHRRRQRSVPTPCASPRRPPHPDRVDPARRCAAQPVPIPASPMYSGRYRRRYGSSSSPTVTTSSACRSNRSATRSETEYWPLGIAHPLRVTACGHARPFQRGPKPPRTPRRCAR